MRSYILARWQDVSGKKQIDNPTGSRSDNRGNEAKVAGEETTLVNVGYRVCTLHLVETAVPLLRKEDRRHSRVKPLPPKRR